jgi:hypothetical protein
LTGFKWIAKMIKDFPGHSLVVEKKVSGSDAVRIKHAAKQFGL